MCSSATFNAQPDFALREAAVLKVAEVPAPKPKQGRPSKQIEHVDESDAETEDFGQGKEHDSDSNDSSASKADASEGSKSGNKRSARPQRASKNRAAKAIAGASTAADLDSDDSDKENAGSCLALPG